VIKYLKYDIPRQLILYNKYNNSLKKLKMINVCNCKIEYLETVKYLHSIYIFDSYYAIHWAGRSGHLEIVKFLEENKHLKNI
jgi:hypothetical protein